MLNYKDWADPATLSHKEIQELIDQTREETIREVDNYLESKLRAWKTVEDEYRDKLDVENKKPNSPTINTNGFINNLILTKNSVSILKDILKELNKLKK